MKKLLQITCLLILLSSNSFSQTIPVGDYAESLARMNQLLGVSDDLSSFCIRPVNSAINSIGDSSLVSMVGSKNLLPKINFLGGPVIIKALPFNWISDYNSKLPYGYNNGPMFPNVGYQTVISGGVFIKAGILNIQFKPEFVHAENAEFLTFADVQANYKSGLIGPFYRVVNSIDAPERFGPFGISGVDLGQSKITLIYKNVELGASTENLWWGPGVQNAIMLSNSAPGFLHWTFNSANPVKTVVGSFEWQIIGGILKQSGYFPYDPGRLVFGNDNLYIPKPKVTRYISAFTANWQPKWVKGLYLGISAYDYTNRDSSYNQSSEFKKLFSVFSGSSGTSNHDDAYSAYLRQVLPKYNAELYFEFARNDQASNVTDFLLVPEHASAFTFGGSRLFDIKNNHFLQVTLELTHLQAPNTFLLSNSLSFYEHIPDPRDGYTNEGRYLGAGIGPGSNSLILDFDYLVKQNSFGIKFERFVHDNDLYYQAFAGTKNYSSEWVDFSSSFYANLKFKQYLISAQVAPVFTFNYEYLPSNIFSLNARVNLTYYFK